MKPNERGNRPLFARAGYVALLLVLAGLVAYSLRLTSAARRHGPDAASPIAGAADASNDGPVRMAHFTYVTGHVDWRPDSRAEWSEAVPNLPLRQDAQVSAVGGRAEIQFDDGSRLRLNRGAVVTLRNLYSDSDGEFTEIALSRGTAAFRLRHNRAVYQVDTPFVAVDATGPSRFRVDSSGGVRVGVQDGQVTVRGDEGKATLTSGQYLALHSNRDPYDVRNLPPPDAFDTWAATRYEKEDHYWNSPHRHYLPDDIAIASDDLDDYGTWHQDAKYGEVWSPRETAPDWRPYHHGHWTWVDPVGWTWVANEPWGWAPSHYGTWVDEPYGWSWVPGPATQYWSPAVVDFTDYNGATAWCPLAPAEVHYPPALSIGFSGGNWAAFFSIGAAAVYYPTYHGYFQPRPWRSRYVNRVTYINNVTNINNYYGGYGAPAFNHNTYLANHGYVPINARLAAGASLAPYGAFGGRGSYRALPRGSGTVFTRGRFVGAPAGRFQPVAGPPRVRPTAIAMTPTRILRRSDPVAHAALTRAVYRDPRPIRNFTAARQRLAAAPARVAAARPRPANRRVTGRLTGPAPRNVPPVRPAARPGPPARPAGPASMAVRRPAPKALTPAQRNAMRARTALGLKPGTPRNRPAAKPMPTHRPGATPAIAAHRPNARQPKRPGAVALSPAQRAAMRARTAVGHKPRTAPAALRAHRAPAPANRNVLRPAARPAQPNRRAATPHPAASMRRTTPPAHRTVQPLRRTTPPMHRTAQPVHRNAPQAHHNATPVRRNTPPVRQHTVPMRRYAPPASHHAAPVRRHTPAARPNRPATQRPVRPVRRYVPPVRNNPAQARRPAPVSHYTAPVRRYTPPVRQNAAPMRRYAPPVQRPAPHAQRPAMSIRRAAAPPRRPASPPRRAQNRRNRPAQNREQR